ncbi:hypothetical protein ACFY7H_12960 [Streptomyces sp. NPDC012794]|uniref:hypothetical protein n=1 Tax=Streptomyces sp. NPDC012794 TaxID=3364850 RepID=UPI00368A49A4
MSGPLKRYQVTTPSGVTTTMKLNAEDAERLGVSTEGSTKEAGGPAADATEAPAKARTPRNKARTAVDKDGGTGGDD